MTSLTLLLPFDLDGAKSVTATAEPGTAVQEDQAVSDLSGKAQQIGFGANKPKRLMPALTYRGWVARGGKMSKLKPGAGVWVLVFLKGLGAGWHTCAVALPGLAAGTCPASP